MIHNSYLPSNIVRIRKTMDSSGFSRGESRLGIACRIEPTNKIVLGKNGSKLIASYRIFVNRSADIKEDDKIEFENGIEYDIIQNSTAYGFSPHHLELIV